MSAFRNYSFYKEGLTETDYSRWCPVSPRAAEMFSRDFILIFLASTACFLPIFLCDSNGENIFLDNLVEEDIEEDDGPESLVTESHASLEDCNSPAARRNTDVYVDKVLSEVRPKLPEPMFLPERVGRFRLFNGTLSNVGSLRRTGPAMVRCSETSFSFLVPVGLKNLTGKYFWEADGGVPVFRGFIDMAIERVDADVLYSRNRNTLDGQPKARVDKLTITRLQGVKVKFDGLGPLNVIASRLTGLATRFLSRSVSRILEGPARNVINRELQNVEKYEMYYF